ncbi:MAG: KTSC domain-containing protein [Pseudomonadota bacterium]|nr:KTSC domain-containing protein [Pseudomonadota bacterium]
MVRVDSEAILEIDYDAAAATLYVRFTDGDWYSYFGVPSGVHQAFLAADSHGRFFHDHIRDRYPFRKGR